MPATPIEAAACGCWPLVPDIDGLAEVFGPLMRDFTYSAADLTAPKLAARIVGILDFRSAHISGPTLGNANAQIIAGNYSIKALVDGYLRLYERIHNDWHGA